MQLSQIADLIGGGTPSSSNVSFWNGSIPWVSSSDIKDDNINDVSITRFITKEAIDKSATKLCSAPVILLVSRVGVGKVALSKKNICTSQDFCNLINIKCNPIFLTYDLARIMKRKSREVQGTSIKGITSDEIQKIKFWLPDKSREQVKIASILSLIDERIATQNKIIDKLQSLIKGLSKYMIHIGKGNVRLKDCLDCHTSTLQENEVNEFGAYPVFGANGIVGYTETKQATSDAILIIKDGSSVGTVYSVTGNFSITGTLSYLTIKKNYSLQYIYFCLKIFNFQPYKTGMAIPHIYFKDYGKAKIYCPKYEKQIFISKGLTAIESKIVVEQKLLSTLIEQKSFLLQQMFI